MLSLISPLLLRLSRRAFWPAVLFIGISCGLAFGAEGERITVCAYNVRNWLTDIQELPGTEQRVITKPESERLRVIQTLVEIQPDVLGLCEIGTEADLADLQRRLKAQGLDLPHQEWTQGADTQRSLALLSRLPILKRQSQRQLEYQMGQLILPMQRGILDVTLEAAPGHPLRLIGVHLKSKREVTEANETLMRRNEAHLLRLHLDAALKENPDLPLLCYGDFNEHRHEAAISEILGNRESTETRLQEISVRDDSGHVWTHFWDLADVYSRFDYFFSNRSLRAAIDLKQSFIYNDPEFLKASDHRPIVLSIKTSALPASP